MKYCPACTSKTLVYDEIKRYFCSSCGWIFYKNPAAAVAGIFEYNGNVLAVRRNRDPMKGLLDFPGGFVDPKESLEDALKRELKEELQADVSDLTYLCSAPNDYEYKGVNYATCDSFFYGKIIQTDFRLEHAEISELLFIPPKELVPEDLAFPSLKVAISKYLEMFYS